MNKRQQKIIGRIVGVLFKNSFLIPIAILVVSLLLGIPSAFGARLQVIAVEKDGTLGALSQYRWIVEEDNTYHVDPGVPDPNTLAVGFHSSYMPVVAQGDNNTPFPTLDPAKYYFVSVIPTIPGTYSIGGAQLVGNGKVTVHLNALPLPTAQISIFVHEDISPISNVWDQGEQGLEGFRIVVEDAGGRYGISAGAQLADAYGNVLGTVYVKTCDENGQNPGSGGYGCLDVDSSPIVATDVAGDPIVNPMTTDPDGLLSIENLAPGKYGIIAIPPNAVEDPPGSGNYVSSSWIQTSTIEGTKVIDAWVKANEPTFFAEFGPPGPHISFGFVPAGPNNPYIDSTVLTGGATISGNIVNLHLSRPPNTAFYNGTSFAHTTPWVGLNLGAAGTGRGVYAARANDDGSFSIPNVPPGNYQLVVWDDNLDLLFAFLGVSVPDATAIDLGDVGVFQWFTRLENWVFYDDNENGFREAGEVGIPEQAVNIRWRDGSVYQSFPTDLDGFVPFDQVFPFFAWLVAEVDFARFKATGLTVTVDDGGPIPFGAPWAWDDQLNPQVQGVPFDPDSDTFPTYRTELGPVLSQGFQGFLGQTSVLEWGKAAYGPGENGGISGIVFYAVTRAEDDPELAAAEPWEPGVPRVTVNLYEYDPGAAPDFRGAWLNSTVTDSWDDSLPANCQYGSNAGSVTDAPYVFRGVATDCFDGMRNWNQVRPGVFDGGYAFDSIIDPVDNVTVISPIPPGQYVVEVVPPTGYEVIKSQDRNVDFGDNYIPSAQLLPAECVGLPYVVPPELTLFPGVPAPLAGQSVNACDRKLVALSNGANAAADFSLFTYVPVSGHIRGFILDDTANEFDPASPQFGEKYAPPWLPISIRDWTGRVIATTYSDEFGAYNVLVPSTYTANLAQPSGMSPNMLTTCMNDPEADTVGGFHNRQYSIFCYTFQYMPGTTTYLDTPVVPIAAFAGSDQNPLDCELVAGVPRIYSVTNTDSQGPYVQTLVDGSIADGNLIITSMGPRNVPNPAYDGVGGLLPKVIVRDYGFGNTPGSVTIGGVAMTNLSWSDGVITGTVAPGTETGQLVVTRGDNAKASVIGVTVQVGKRPGSRARVVQSGGTIQAAIDAAAANDLILVPPGFYDEMVIMWKPVQLQGWGEGSTMINAVKAPAEKLVAWRQHVELLSSEYDLVDGQTAPVGGLVADALFSEEGAGLLVLAKKDGINSFSNTDNRGARIDGFTITGADTGGGIVVNGYADFLDISNNRIMSNSGFFGGGVRIGHPLFSYTHRGRVFNTDSDNDNIRIRYNHITQNGGLDGAGGGLSLCTGSDNYEVSQNFICGNFTLQDGAGIAHLGKSENGLIQENTILFNENFNQGMTVNGGGISIAGKAPAGCPVDPLTGVQDPACLADPNFSLSPGSGSVRVVRNLIQGNAAGAGDGGGIRLNRINGQDVAQHQTTPSSWHTVEIVNNMIVNNVASLAGGGISLQDTLRTRILHNTISSNDSTATAGEAFMPGQPNQSNPQPGAGVVSRVHSGALAGFLPPGEAAFSDPELVDNILWHNRKFYFLVDDTDPANVLNGLCPDINNTVGLNCTGFIQLYDDLAVLPQGSGFLSPSYSLLTDITDYQNNNNIQTFPVFNIEYANGNRESTVTNPEGTTALQPVVAFDEGGNFIRLRFGPLTQTRVDNGLFYGDYHIQSTSTAVDAGTNVGISNDFDGEPRPSGAAEDMGADEVQQVQILTEDTKRRDKKIRPDKKKKRTRTRVKR
jgi:large repetitive protein